MRSPGTCPARPTCRLSKASRPKDRQEEQARKKKDLAEAERHASEDEPFCGLVFKVLPAKTGDMSYVRIYSGVLKENSRVLNPGKEEKENVAQLWHIQASRKR